MLATLSDRTSVAPPKRAEQGRPSKNAPYEKLHISVSSPADYPFIFAVLKKNEPRPLVHPLLDFLILFLAWFSESPFLVSIDRSSLPSCCFISSSLHSRRFYYLRTPDLHSSRRRFRVAASLRVFLQADSAHKFSRGPRKRKKKKKK